MAKAAFLLETLWDCQSCHFQLLEVAHSPWILVPNVSPFLPLLPSLHDLVSGFDWPSRLTLRRTLVTTLRTTQVFQDNLPIWRLLNKSHLQNSFCHISNTFIGSRIRMWALGGGGVHYPTCHSLQVYFVVVCGGFSPPRIIHKNHEIIHLLKPVPPSKDNTNFINEIKWVKAILISYNIDYKNGSENYLSDMWNLSTLDS